jgi:sugar lactone lactonase YvrE
MIVSVALDIDNELGESPVWSVREAALYWVDISGRRIHRLHPASGAHRAWETPSEPGCLAVARSGGLVLAMRSGFARLDTDSGAVTMLGCPDYDRSRMRFNDGRCDAAGRFWAGTLDERRELADCGLWRLDPDGTIHRGPHGLILSNGLAFSPDGRTMYHADTEAGRIFRHDYDVTTGAPGQRETWLDFAPEEGRPDGAAVDAEGRYWVAMYGAGQILRLGTAGEVLARISLPTPWVTMVAFGGRDLRDLYITTSRRKRSAKELAAHPLTGRLLVARVDVPGRPEPEFGG